MKFVCVDKINNPKSENNGLWTVSVAEELSRPMKCVFMNKSKKACVEYAKTISGNPVVKNGREYGARW